MRSGRPGQFEIEAIFDEVVGTWMCGNLRFWIGGEAVGDFEDTSDLASSARWGRTFLDASGQRTRGDLDILSTAEVFELLYGAYVVAMDEVPTDIWLERGAGYEHREWVRDPYLLDDVGESALRDKYAVVVVRRADGADRVIVKSYLDERLFEVLVDEGVIDAAIGAYYAWVEGLWREAGGGDWWNQR